MSGALSAPASRFPEGFLWGAATSAYQVEGAAAADGRGPSIWDVFCRQPGRVRNGDTGDVACDHYRRYREDLDLMAELGLRAYRFSVAWPRVLPEGTGKVNPAGLDFYRRLVEGLVERGMVPVATLYHWDLPQALQDRGGWATREAVRWFADYASAVASALGDLVPYWVTQNEPWVAAFLGHATGLHAPGVRDWDTALAVAHHLLLSHAAAARAIRERHPEARVGVALDLHHLEPATERPEDVAAAARMDGFRNRWFLDPLLLGRYPEDLTTRYRDRGLDRSWLRPGDLQELRGSLDFLGVNYYAMTVVRDAPGEGPLELAAVPPEGPVTAMGWRVAPEGLHRLLVRLARDYPPLPILITENGAAYDDALADGEVLDDERVRYLASHVAAAGAALADGVDLRGYFVWSFLDNFEWTEGYSKRFGLVYVDYETQWRVPKRSASWYRDLIGSSRGAVDPARPVGAGQGPDRAGGPAAG
ncbi:MAG TPA: GH1 family beta-glucosidase [Actinomycetota bacterium]|nr:GH1 family beta-glucosidase [Actinomycetota bacterium]